MKYIITSIVVAFVLIFFVPQLSFVYADTKPSEGKQGAEQSKSLEKDKQKAFDRIDKRLYKLKQLTAQVTKTKHLTVTDKKDILQQLNDASSSLRSLRKKVAADTDKKVIQSDVKQIAQKYHVYLVFTPKVNALITVDSLTATTDTLSSLSAKMKDRIDLVTADPAVSTASGQLQLLYSDMTNKIASAHAEIQQISSLAAGLKADEYPKNKTVIDSLKKFIKDAKKVLRDAQNDAKKIVLILKKLPEPSQSAVPTPGASTTLTPTVVVTDTPVPTDMPLPSDTPEPTREVTITDTPMPTTPADPSLTPAF